MTAKIYLWYDITRDAFVLALPDLPRVYLPWSKELDDLANQALGKYFAEISAAE